MSTGITGGPLSRYAIFVEPGYVAAEPFLVTDNGPIIVLANIDGRITFRQAPTANA